MAKSTKRKWRQYKPTPYDLNRDPTLAESKSFNWKIYREIQPKRKQKYEGRTE
jgi:hypothetical protein